ncbi:WxcM-like domain-containing protein [Campylobacter upsaliensis]|uniref:sugar 3,4-ketoisomerase n=1 Tax=Campylobacter upsaliensis TaxID=28080 RepID=UPI00127DB412|nr:FdtA/QdtA family cupin domain-containing protein [Campylobacter upsaliensis]EAK0455006.1 WxcM-like domain-containing protein [Campylobacter upsaliensis]EAK0839837.1 WxcM-like domain-containing protein [Campylobacter upsaliensis]EAL3911892.1 WxcM-like domain-containing protein [Campylobacter upsaliensis]EDP7981084.1 WxcM-like domain-containing protein [Campylobacter upsaliensis]EGJ6309982.1 WxcM-like domain-containing protein [Campylobacter upsaliensis]
MYKMIDLQMYNDKGSMLIALQKNANCPFEIKRAFYIFGVPKDVIRGEHANKNSQFLFVTLQGACKICVDNGVKKEEFLLDSPQKALYLDKMLWKEMYHFSENCILLVLSDCYYDKDEYIYDYEAFKQIRGGGGSFRYLLEVA